MAEKLCPKCGGECGRDEVHNGVSMLHGPWGCGCGWSEREEYDLSDGRPARRDGGVIDQYGGFTPGAASLKARAKLEAANV